MSTTATPSAHTKKWIDTFHHLHPSHRGTYSVERLQALKKYCDEASPWRVMAVCIALPAPALLVAIMNECIPLQKPQDGWKANYGVWIRLFLIAFFSSIALIVQTNEMVPLSKLTRSKTLLVATTASVFYVGAQCVVANAWVFPIPFGYIMFAPVYSNSLMITFVLAVGISNFRKNPVLGQQLRQQLGIIVVQTGLVCIYPAFSAVYVRLEPLHQTAFVFVLPLIKFAMQSAVVRLASQVEEYIPGIIVFSVEVFNALYLTKCMQSAKSSSTYLAIMLFDAFEMVLAFLEMNNQVSNLHRMQTQYNSISAQSLLDTVLAVCKEPGVLDSKEAAFIRLRSSLQLRISKSTVDPNNRIEDMVYESVAVKDQAATNVVSVAEKRAFVHHALKVMFQCEYHVLVEYVEAIIPMIYALYVVILCHLPSSEYYPETRDMDSGRVASMALNVMAYAWLEILSLVALHFAVKKKFGFSPVYVLAFVLENQAIELQARLTVWLVYILQLTLVHFGVDFTLQFAWMKRH